MRCTPTFGEVPFSLYNMPFDGAPSDAVRPTGWYSMLLGTFSSLKLAPCGFCRLAPRLIVCALMVCLRRAVHRRLFHARRLDRWDHHIAARIVSASTV